MSNVWQKKIDQFWYQTILRFLPKFVKPNVFTIIRLILIPVVLLVMAWQQFLIAFLLFLLAAICDSLDGSLARIKKQSSAWGQFLDPIADKLLVLLVLIFFFFFYPAPSILFLAILADLLMVLAAMFFIIFYPKIDLPRSNIFGKGKMLSQVVALALVFLFLIFPNLWLFWLSALFLMLSFLMGIAALLVYGYEAVLKK